MQKGNSHTWSTASPFTSPTPASVAKGNNHCCQYPIGIRPDQSLVVGDLWSSQYHDFFFHNLSTSLPTFTVIQALHICIHCSKCWTMVHLGPSHCVIGMGCYWYSVALHSACRHLKCTQPSQQPPWALSQPSQSWLWLQARVSSLSASNFHVSHPWHLHHQRPGPCPFYCHVGIECSGEDCSGQWGHTGLHSQRWGEWHSGYSHKIHIH